MDKSSCQNERLLLIDTCGETPGIALSRGEDVVASEDLPKGRSSAEIIEAVRRLLLTRARWRVHDLDGIGVVHGPGSFTGTRAGLSTAKGFSEATGLPMAAVSRLEVLASAAGILTGYAVLDAGRAEVYVREIPTGREWLSSLANLRLQGHGEPIVVAETKLVDALEGCKTTLRPLHAADCVVSVLRSLRMGGSDVATSDGNYVRQECDIYRTSNGAIG